MAVILLNVGRAGRSRTFKQRVLSTRALPFAYCPIWYPVTDSNRELSAPKANASAVGLTGRVNLVENIGLEPICYSACETDSHPRQLHSPTLVPIAKTRTRNIRFTGAALYHLSYIGISDASPFWRRVSESNRPTVTGPQFSGLFGSLICRTRQNKIKRPQPSRVEASGIYSSRAKIKSAYSPWLSG